MKVLFMGFDLHRPEGPCSDNGVNDVLTISMYKEGVPHQHHHFCGKLGTFHRLIKHKIDQVQFTFRTALESKLTNKHKGFVLGISLFDTRLENIDKYHTNTTYLLSSEGSQSAALSVVIIVAVVLLLCCMGILLGVTRDYCKDCCQRGGKSKGSEMKNMIEEEEEDNIQEKSNSTNVMYASSV